MKISKQGKSECMLTTIAALSNTPLSHVRKRARELSGGETWNKIAIGGRHNEDKSTIFWLMTTILAKEYNIENKLPTKQEYYKGNRRRKLPPNTKGCVATMGHIAPFENGLVFSTEKIHKPLPIKEYIDFNLGKLEGIWY